MIVFLTALDRQGELRQIFLAGEIETGFAFLDGAAQRGDTLLNVAISEGTQKSQLPVDLFADRAWMPDLIALETEWKRILSNPTPIRALYKHRFVTLRDKRVERHTRCIARLEQLVIAAEARLERVSARLTSEPSRSRILHQLAGTLKRHQQNLTTEQAGLSILLAEST